MGTRVSVGILLAAGLVLLALRPGERIIIGIFLIIVLSVIRFYDLRRGRLRFVPLPLTIIALLLPWRDARSYLEVVGHNANEVCGRERRRHIWHAVVAAPGTFLTMWHGWLRAKLVGLIARGLSPRVHHVQALVRDPNVDPRQYDAALRRLRRYCWLIVCAAGNEQFPECTGPARALLLMCRRLAQDGDDGELGERVLQEAEKLACALANRRPDRA